MTFKIGLLALLFAPLLPAKAEWSNMSRDDECIIGQQWELGTTIFITKKTSEQEDTLTGSVTSDDVLIYIANDDWVSLKRNSEKLYGDFALRFEDEDGNWLEGQPIIGDQSLLLVTKLEWLRNFRYSSSMMITRDGQKVGIYDWDFGLRFRSFERCIRSARAPILERQRQERVRRETPVDPFAE